MYDSQILVERIRKIANVKGIGIVKLHELCGMSRNVISQTANRKKGMTAENLYSLAEVLDCSVDYLLGRTDSPELEHEQGTSIGLNSNNGMQAFHDMPIMLTVPADVQSEQQQEISSMLSDLNPRERTKLMSMIYDYYDECKGGRRNG